MGVASALQVFNRYRERGGEEKSVERIFGHVSELYSIEKCWFDSREWDEPGAPGSLRQALLIGTHPNQNRGSQPTHMRRHPPLLLGCTQANPYYVRLSYVDGFNDVLVFLLGELVEGGVSGYQRPVDWGNA